jgi:hypothetical protein
MANKHTAYFIAKKFDIERLVTIRLLSLSNEDVEIGKTEDFWEFIPRSLNIKQFFSEIANRNDFCIAGK